MLVDHVPIEAVFGHAFARCAAVRDDDRGRTNSMASSLSDEPRVVLSGLVGPITFGLHQTIGLQVHIVIFWHRVTVVTKPRVKPRII